MDNKGTSGTEPGQSTSLEAGWDQIDGPAVRTVTAVVVGCGNRGQNYAAFALDFPSRLKIVGLAEPVSLSVLSLKRVFRYIVSLQQVNKYIYKQETFLMLNFPGRELSWL